MIEIEFAIEEARQEKHTVDNLAAITEKLIRTLRKGDPIIKNPLLLIAAFPRSGTKYTAKILQQVGLDINHEVLRADGSVSWFHILFDEEIKYQHIFHQVRHPLDAISSSQELDDGFIDYMGRFVLVPDKKEAPGFIRRAHAWLGWNRFISSKAEFCFRVEEMEKILPEISYRTGRVFSASLQGLIDFTWWDGPKEYKKITWDDLEKEKLAKEIRKEALICGYGV